MTDLLKSLKEKKADLEKKFQQLQQTKVTVNKQLRTAKDQLRQIFAEEARVQGAYKQLEEIEKEQTPDTQKAKGDEGKKVN